MNEVNQVLERFVYEKQNNSLCSSHKAYARFRRLGISHMQPLLWLFYYFFSYFAALQSYSSFVVNEVQSNQDIQISNSPFVCH